MPNFLFNYLTLFQVHGKAPGAGTTQYHGEKGPGNNLSGSPRLIDNLQQTSRTAIDADPKTIISGDLIAGRTQLTASGRKSLGDSMQTMMDRAGFELPKLNADYDKPGYDLKIYAAYSKLADKHNLDLKNKDHKIVTLQEGGSITIANLKKLTDYYNKPEAPAKPETPIAVKPEASFARVKDLISNEKFKHYRDEQADYEAKPPTKEKNKQAKEAISNSIKESMTKLNLSDDELQRVEKALALKGKDLPDGMKEVMRFQMAYNLKNKPPIQEDGKFFVKSLAAMEKVMGSSVAETKPVVAAVSGQNQPANASFNQVVAAKNEPQPPQTSAEALKITLNPKTPPEVVKALDGHLNQNDLPLNQRKTYGGFQFIRLNNDIIYRSENNPKYTSIISGERDLVVGVDTATQSLVAKKDNPTNQPAPPQAEASSGEESVAR